MLGLSLATKILLTIYFMIRVLSPNRTVVKAKLVISQKTVHNQMKTCGVYTVHLLYAG